MTGIVDELSKLNGELSQSGEGVDKEKLKEGKELIEKLSGLIYEIKTDKPLKPLTGTHSLVLSLLLLMVSSTDNGLNVTSLE